MRCSACRREVSARDRFCPGCGKAVNGGRAPEPALGGSDDETSDTEPNDPPRAGPGSAMVTLDPEGRLLGLEIEPSSVAPVSGDEASMGSGARDSTPGENGVDPLRAVFPWPWHRG
jgi:hypothetical protein